MTDYRQIAEQPPLMYDATKAAEQNAKAAMAWFTEYEKAAAALTEAQATIARQQVMLDRALESNGDMQATIARLEEDRAWRPIADDPPPYETRVLTWWPGNGLLNPVIRIDQRNSGKMLGKRDGWWISPPAEFPTHWQPLPGGSKTPDTDK